MPCPSGSFSYPVMRGDTLFFIAQRYGTTVSAILAINPQITNPDLIFPGELICVPTRPPFPPAPCPTGSFQYTIQLGDTLFFIAQRYGTTVAAIVALNPQITNPNFIIQGQVICVPATPPAPVMCPANAFSYAVIQGDTLFFIAQRYGTTVSAILAINPQIVNPNIIFPGQVICVPARITVPPPPPPVCGPNTFAYLVKRGDTLFGIAITYGTTVAQILNINPQITDPDLIFPGQVICVPATPPAPPPCPSDSFSLAVRAGDTLFVIAQRYGTTVGDILAINPQITNPNLIFAGQIICMPQQPPLPPEGCGINSYPYPVQLGDNLNLIAFNYGTTVSEILAVNPQITDPAQIVPGQVICIPIA